MKIFIFVSLFIFSQTIFSQSEFWGITSAGGQFGVGTIFKTNGSGNNHVIEHSFFQIEGAGPCYTHLIQGGDGLLYGLTSGGGSYNMGLLFQYDPANDVYVKKIDFDGVSNGEFPKGSLMQAIDGKFYGLTSQGGLNDMGVLFQYDPATNICIKKCDFSGSANGSHPYGSLVQATDGMLYGMAADGGANNLGTLFQYNSNTSTLTKKWDFDGALTGNMPFGSVIQASDGKLYGMTVYGGVNDMGVLFQYDLSTGILVKKNDFNGYSNGSYPESALIQAADGMLYGLTKRGGLSNMGVLFQYNPLTNGFIKKIEFAGNSTGSYPRGSLTQASDGSLYGVTFAGGVNDLGVLFQFNPTTNSFTKKNDFSGVTNGGNPQGTVMQAADGNIYGMTNTGGSDNAGVLFKFDPITNIYSKKQDFIKSIDGRNTRGSLILASDGMFYGMTFNGGTDNFGVIFQYDRMTHIYTKKIDFTGAGNGKFPEGSLVQASNGMLYGMTTYGGANNVGALFKYDISTNTCTKTHDFSLATSGGVPHGSLMQAADGMLYGMTHSGGAGNAGVLFQYNPATDTYVKKIDFLGTSNGSSPFGSLMQASDGMIYGATFNGGTSSNGILFQYNTLTNILTKKFDFVNTNGLNPQGALVQHTNGKLYGICTLGGTYGKGTLFEFDINSNTYSKKFDFDGIQKGMNPHGSLLPATDGNIYGMTLLGGSDNLGVLFQFVPATNTYNKKIDFNTVNGANPYKTNLLEIAETATGLNEKATANRNCIIYPNPSGETLNIDLQDFDEKTVVLEVYDIVGNLMFSESLHLKNNSIAVSQLERGMYLLKIISDKNNLYTKNIIKN
ncbi:MAG: choice-of-anchor tandem repeat GloVer-containing protein [Bacteroidota bacterium]